jgi:hypothetical protein
LDAPAARLVAKVRRLRAVLSGLAGLSWQI